MKHLLMLSIALLVTSGVWAQDPPEPANWQITNRNSIVWHPDTAKIPYRDNIEMAGKNVAAIIYYQVDEAGNLTVEKDIIFPQLRTYNKTNEPNWKKYRAYFRRNAASDLQPALNVGDLTINPTKIDSIEIGGMIRFYFAPVDDMLLTKTIYPSMEDRVLVEEWNILNMGSMAKQLNLAPINHEQSEHGYKGLYKFIVQSGGQQSVTLKPNTSYTFPVYFGATLNGESSKAFDYKDAKKSRDEFLETCQKNLILETPDEALNTLFYFSKIRAAESIFNSSMGVVHSPGGGNYYVGVWANDQVEYSGPFFPYLGYVVGSEAAYNTYKKFLENIPNDTSHIAYAFEVDGNFAMTHLDRGDAAMIAYGTSLYLLNAGNQQQAQELWPLIEWALSYCSRKQNEAGAVVSESDEMEGRIATGDANLSTSTLYYGGLKYGAIIAKNLGKRNLAKTYTRQLGKMKQVIENYFGATIEHVNTYRYFKGHSYLRHWICLPLTMGITDRKEGTIKALFDKLWTENGVLVEYNPEGETQEVFWDRATLYALRGALKVGATAQGMEKLRSYSMQRLLGDHVPYAVEAYPENNMKHLSAESALYCRIFLEGLLGIEPTGFTSISLTPALPDGWDSMQLSNIFLRGQAYDISLERSDGKIQIQISNSDKVFVNKTVNPHQKIAIPLR